MGQRQTCLGTFPADLFIQVRGISGGVYNPSMKVRIIAVFALLACLSATAIGQLRVQTSSGPNGQLSLTAEFEPPPFSISGITGAPYSAVQVFETTQTLNDGTHISNPQRTIHLWRDSAGRTRTERPFFSPPQLQPRDSLLVEISDPVVNCQYILDMVNHVAHRIFAPPPQFGQPGFRSGLITGRTATQGSPPAAIDPPAEARPRPQVSSESLGTRVIEGVLAEGRLTRITHPVGSMGNDQPIVTTNEVWMSRELRVMVLSKSTDPRSGEHITRLTDIDRSEPDPSLFQVPPGYTIVDETGRFTIKITIP
jgi:hypothetical protein